MDTNIASLSEDELVMGLKDGSITSPEAYKRLYMTLYPFLLRIAQHYKSDPDEVEDLVVDALARLPKFLESYKGKASFRAYYVSVMRYLMADSYRRRALHRKLLEITEEMIL